MHQLGGGEKTPDDSGHAELSPHAQAAATTNAPELLPIQDEKAQRYCLCEIPG
jgi:hypothetical protein